MTSAAVSQHLKVLREAEILLMTKRAQLGPEGEKHWSWVDYLSIDPGKSFSAFDGFCDEQGVKDPNMPANEWHNEFVPMGKRTKVIVTLTFKSADDLQKIVEMGFKEGFTMCLDQLEELLG